MIKTKTMEIKDKMMKTKKTKDQILIIKTKSMMKTKKTKYQILIIKTKSRK